MKKKWVVGFLLLALVLFIFGSLVLTGFNIFLAFGNQGGKINYGLMDIKEFVQCFDADPQNLKNVKSACHAQYYVSENGRLIGMNAVDYCKSKNEVVDFYCAGDLSCQEIISECEDGFVCEDGQCVKKKGYLEFPVFSRLKFFN